MKSPEMSDNQIAEASKKPFSEAQQNTPSFFILKIMMLVKLVTLHQKTIVIKLLRR